MTETLTIGAVARQAGVSTKTIRFYEAQGVLPRPARTDNGYRFYSPSDVRRLRLIRRARLLGVPLPEVKLLADQALSATRDDFGEQLLHFIASQRAAIDHRMADLTALKTELDDLEVHARHSQARAWPGQRVADCVYCPLLDEEGGECDD
jgi:DNA-binding transcriptional MerR regulator